MKISISSNRTRPPGKMKAALVTAMLVLFALAAQAQVGIGTSTPDGSSQLDITSAEKGILIPRMSSTERGNIANPAQGLLVYQTDAPIGFYYYSINTWTRLTNTADIAAPASPVIPSGYAANTNGPAIPVVLNGTDIPFPNAQKLSGGFTMDGTNTVMTVANAGRYQISYKMNTTAALLISARVRVNGADLAGSLVNPLISVNNFASTVIADLPAGSTIQVQFFGLLGIAVLAGDAFLSVVKLQ